MKQLIHISLYIYKLFHFCTCTEIIYGCLSTEAQPAICGHDIGVVGPFLSNRNVFRVVIAFLTRNGLGEFEIVIQTQDEVEGLYNCRECSQSIECLYQALPIQKKSFLLLL